MLSKTLGTRQGVAILTFGCGLLGLAPAGCNAFLGLEEPTDLAVDGSQGDTPGLGLLGQACTPAGAYACAGHAQKGQLICNSVWAANGMCNSNQNCDSTQEGSVGSCQPIVPKCLSKNPGDSFCTGQTVETCGADLVTLTATPCPDGYCNGAGVCGVCASGATRCASQSATQKCDASGQWQAATPCPDGYCNGAGVCGVCASGATRCASPTATQTCDESGEWQAATSCPDGYCNGAGLCGVCASGAIGCASTNVPQTCDVTGHWQPRSCPAGSCSLGRCQVVFSFKGNSQSFTVPSGISSLVVKAWGAGGGSFETPGGAGGFVMGTIGVTPGEILTVVVGGGGGGLNAGGGGYGGGGRPANRGGGGGGRSALRRGESDIITAGGGGGSDCGASTAGGAGGGVVGKDGGSGAGGGGKGGTQSAGGAGGFTDKSAINERGQAGSQYQGGNGTCDDAAGGGGGFYGGGGGGCYNTCDDGGGGGGSSLVPAGGSTLAGTGAIPGGTADVDYQRGIGVGGTNSGAGGNGLVIIFL